MLGKSSCVEIQAREVAVIDLYSDRNRQAEGDGPDVLTYSHRVHRRGDRRGTGRRSPNHCPVSAGIGVQFAPEYALGHLPLAIAKGSPCSYHGYMKEVAAREAKNRFGHLLDAAQSAPVRVTRKGRAIGVMMSVQQYERLRGAAWERLTATMDTLGEEASAKGLTKARLEALLADES